MPDRGHWVAALSLVATFAVPIECQVPAPGSPAKSPLAGPRSQQAAALDVGSVITGALEDGDLVWPERRYLDSWAVIARAGSTVTIDLASDEFDPVLYVVGPSQLTWDDDGGGGCNARMQVTFSQNGTYTLMVSSYGADGTGTYTLQVTNRPGAPPQSTCGQRSPEPSSAPPNETCEKVRWMEWLSFATAAGGGPEYPALAARERTACELGLEAQSGETWGNGRTMHLSGRWDYPSGRTAFFAGRWDYPNGRTALFAGRWDYPNGRTAYFAGNWYLPDGTPSSPAGIIEFSLARLTPERGEQLLENYRTSGGDAQTLFLVVMASEASR